MHPSERALNDYVDEDPTSDRAVIEGHLATCDRCRTLVADLRALMAQSAALDDVAPPADAWTRIAAAIRDEQRSAPAGIVAIPTPERPPATVTTRRQSSVLAAAAVILLSVAIGWRWYLSDGPPGSSQGEPAADQTIAVELRQAEEHYQRAIAGLEQIARTEQGDLDAQTAATLQKSLAVVDEAISESRAALRSEPTSEPAQESLLANFRTKIDLLQETIALINEMRKGDETGAARIVSGMNQQR
jgi:anti-sigma factor RsiW